jgi:hypothetical protein
MTPNVCPRRFGIRDAKRPNRERETLISEITRLVNRMKACLVRFGVRGFDPILRRAAGRLEKLITPERVRLPPLTLAEMLRHGAATLSWRANPIDRESPCHALNPFDGMPAQLWRTSRHRFGLECVPTPATIFRQPIINSSAVDAQRLRHHFWTLSILHTSNRARSHFFERLVIQLARVILSHTLGESYSILRVKRNVGLLTARLNNTDVSFGGHSRRSPAPASYPPR